MRNIACNNTVLVAMSACAPDAKFPVLLLFERRLDQSHAKEVAGWFRRFPGPISIKIVSRLVDLQLNGEGKLTW
jgi:hypothetical protein